MLKTKYPKVNNSNEIYQEPATHSLTHQLTFLLSIPQIVNFELSLTIH